MSPMAAPRVLNSVGRAYLANDRSSSSPIASSCRRTASSAGSVITFSANFREETAARGADQIGAEAIGACDIFRMCSHGREHPACRRRWIGGDGGEARTGGCDIGEWQREGGKSATVGRESELAGGKVTPVSKRLEDPL